VTKSEKVYEMRVHGNKVYWYALVYKVEDGVIVRVVLQRIGIGKIVFLSVMPHREL
jgi:hypothetical protein